MSLNFIFLEEWNSSAVAVILALFLVPVLLIYFLFTGILKSIPKTNAYLKKQKATNKLLYYLQLVMLFLFSAVIVYLLFNLKY